MGKIDWAGHIRTHLIYLDNAASSRRGAYLSYQIADNFGKTRSFKERMQILRKAELRLLDLLGVVGEESEISFVPNATYGINHLAYFYTETGSLTRPSKIKIPIYLSDSEHASNHLIWIKLSDKPVNYLSLLEFKGWRLPANASIFSFACTTNLEGIRISIEDINDKFKNSNHICIVDASQMFQHQIPYLEGSPIRHLVFTAHKFFGPNGLGVIYSKGECLVGINHSNYSSSSVNYGMDFDSLEVWINELDVVEEMFVSGLVEREQKRLNGYFADHFPKTNRYLEWINLDSDGLIFLLKVVDEEISAHDYAFYLGLNGIVVRSGLSCSWLSGSKFDGTKILRVSLGIFNSTEELDNFFDLVRSFSILDCF